MALGDISLGMESGFDVAQEIVILTSSNDRYEHDDYAGLIAGSPAGAS